ncbi:hypothetical protein E1B28_009736 [Marasmius oreades]|uniref:CFEM domain-containing protein n=1 Tax=Marasmius oreades TaxID=181124 RepID=A0A9P7USY3_9AGAR|nr:uncharacterized protein E1B28_009736 [Marasmius oreades]KAG7090634.1 hypothetical protein E1B28_009736 [Marasmius oreades]
MAYRKLQAVIVAVLVGRASAQFSGLPACAQGCVTTATGPVGCTASDLQCLCGSRPFLSAVQRCISRNCEDLQEAATSLQIIQNACDATTGTGTSTGTFSGTATDTSSVSSPSSILTTSSSTSDLTTSITTPLTSSSETTPLTQPTTTSTPTTLVTTDTNTVTTISTPASVPPIQTPTFTTKPTASLTVQDSGSPVQTQGGNGAMTAHVSGSFLSTICGMIGAALLAI